MITLLQKTTTDSEKPQFRLLIIDARTVVLIGALAMKYFYKKNHTRLS